MIRRFTFLLYSVCILFSCSHTENDEARAKAAVKDFLSKQLHDFSSYESVEFQLDTASAGYSSVYDASDLKRRMDSLLPLTYSDLLYDGSYNIDSMKHQYDSLYKVYFSFVHDHSQGWVVTHSYRSKNPLGNLVLSLGHFELDTNFKITSHKLSGSAD